MNAPPTMIGHLGRNALALALGVSLLGGCAAMRRDEAMNAEDLLLAAGFKVRAADTPEQQAELQAMPPLKMQMRSREGNVVFTYADPYNCQCLLVGDQAAYSKYKQLALEKQIADERLEASVAEENAAMNWGMWGPWWW